MFKINDSNIALSYIQNFLSTFSLPSFKVLKANMTIFKNKYYIHGNLILKANSTFNIPNIDSSLISTLYLNRFIVIDSSYTYGQYIPNLTSYTPINDIIYDSYTHERLGEFLRFYRDYKNINLMSLYNCFSSNSPSSLLIKNSNGIDFNTSNNAYKVYMLPVKIGEKYTIAIDCPTKVEIICDYYNVKLLSSSFNKWSTHTSHFNTSFKQPFLYEELTKNLFDNVTQDEINLKMFIKVPRGCNSSIVILEGDFTKSNHAFMNGDYQVVPTYKIYDDTDKKFIINYPKKLQLLELNTQESYVFSDRLLEYLFNMTIDSTCKIKNNVELLQSKLKEIDDKAPIIKNGLWQDSMQDTIQKIALDKNLYNKYFDILGYCDKDVEATLKYLEGVDEDE